MIAFVRIKMTYYKINYIKKRTYLLISIRLIIFHLNNHRKIKINLSSIRNIPC